MIDQTVHGQAWKETVAKSPSSLGQMPLRGCKLPGESKGHDCFVPVACSCAHCFHCIDCIRACHKHACKVPKPSYFCCRNQHQSLLSQEENESSCRDAAGSKQASAHVTT